MKYLLYHVQRTSVSHSSARNTIADDCLDGTTLTLSQGAYCLVTHVTDLMFI